MVLQTKEDCGLSKRCCRDQAADVHPLHWIMAAGNASQIRANNYGQVFLLLTCVSVCVGNEHFAPSSQHPRQPEAPLQPGGWYLVLCWRPIHRREWILSPTFPVFIRSYLPLLFSSSSAQYQARLFPGYCPTTPNTCGLFAYYNDLKPFRS